MKKIFIASFLFLLCSAYAAPLKIGWASRDVSTAEPIAIPGHFNLRLSKGISDPTLVTALVIENSQDSVIFLSCDVLGIYRHIAAGIKERLKKTDPAVPVEKLIINATHSHTSATLIPYRKSIPDEIKTCDEKKYISFFMDQAAEAVAEAWKKRSPGAVAWGYGYVVAAHSRRVVYSDDLSRRPGQNRFTGIQNGHAKMHGSTADPKFSHYEAGSDAFANYLFTFDPDGKLTGAIINLPATAQCGGDMQRISADYWHEARLALRKKFGPIHILPQCAAAGDLTPGLQHYKAAQARRIRLKYGKDVNLGIGRRLDITEQIMNSFSEVLAWAKKDIRKELPLKHIVRVVKLDRKTVTEEEFNEARRHLAEMEKQNADITALPPEKQLFQQTRRLTLAAKLKNVIRRYETQKKTPAVFSEIHVVRLGNIAFATNTFELFMDYMHRIQGRSPFEQTFIIELAGSDRPVARGYLPTERAVRNKGYSACVYCSDIVSPLGGQQLVDETVRALNSLLPKSKKAKKETGFGGI